MLYGVEGWGKTTLAAHWPDAAFILSPRETGYLTLLQSGRVPKRPICQPQSWDGLLAEIDALVADPRGIKLLAMDAMSGFERLCHEHVCEREFEGDWGEKGFLSYHKGYDMSITPWLSLLARLDGLRFKHGVSVMLVSHARITTFKNPSGPDFDRYSSDVHDKTWGVTRKWADAVLFGMFFDVTKKEKGERVKGVGDQQRVLYTERTATYDAKNRFGLPEVIDIPNDHAQSYAALASAMKGQ